MDRHGEPSTSSLETSDGTAPEKHARCSGEQPGGSGGAGPSAGGEDDDEDGIVDFPFDVGGTAAADPDETDPAPEDLPACSNGLDDDGDGVADKSTVFYQGTDINSALGICVLGNKVIVSCAPNVFVFTDEDGDGNGDGDGDA